MGLKFANFGKAIVSSAPAGPSGLSFTVQAGKGLLFPTLGAGDYFYGIFKDASGNREVVKIEARSSDTLTIAAGGRGLDGTTARTWAAGDYFVAGLVSAALSETLSNANVVAFGQLVGSADKVPYFTGSAAFALATLTPFIRSLMDDADAAAARATLGAASAASVAAVIPSGSTTDWFQANAPTGWTKITAHNNKALRIVSGSGGGSGGSQPFSTAFASKSVTGTVGYHSLTIAEMPWHQHTTTFYLTSGGGAFPSRGGSGSSGANFGTSGDGGGAGHNHSFTGTAINLAVQYIDMILASKD